MLAESRSGCAFSPEWLYSVRQEFVVHVWLMRKERELLDWTDQELLLHPESSKTGQGAMLEGFDPGSSWAGPG